MDIRLKHLEKWLATELNDDNFQVRLLANDASFRRYFRADYQGKQFVVMDAPPAQEPCAAYATIAKHFHNIGINVPRILASDLEQGFLLLTDFGDNLFFKQLNADNADKLYRTAIDELIKIQQCETIESYSFGNFINDNIRTELTNFQEWYLQAYLKLTLSTDEQAMLNNSFNFLIENAKQQPQLCMHRDYHSRNLMLIKNNQIGVLDFQDTTWGPVTYDIVSLLKDCYIAWPKEKIMQWLGYYHQQAIKNSIIDNAISLPQLTTWFELMGMQRHLKASFIFARKFLRDNDDRYLKDIPRTLNYVTDIIVDYSELQELHKFLQQRVL